MSGLQIIGMHTPIWPNPLQMSCFGDELILLSNLVNIATKVTKTSFPVVINLNCNHMGEIVNLLSGESHLTKQGFGDVSRYFVQSHKVGCDTLPFEHEIKPLWFNRIYVPQIQTFGELYVFFINKTVISIVHRQPKTTDCHLVLAVTPLDLLL
jgi:hypothetical protein